MNPHPLPHQRLYYLDWLRIAAFVLLVLYHVGMLYVPWPFHVKHDPTYPALEPLMRLSNPWRMGLLFVISGVATGLMLGRPGLARERSRRLLLPLLLGMAVIVPPQAWLQVREQFGYTGSYLDFLRLYFSAYGGFCHGTQCLALPTWNHLWFLPYLWAYTLLCLLALHALPAAWLRRAAGWLAGAMTGSHGWRLLLVPLVFLAAVRVLLFPRFGETHALLDDWAAHAVFLPLFAFGLLLARRPVLQAEAAGAALAGAGAGPGRLGGAGALPGAAARLAVAARGAAPADAPGLCGGAVGRHRRRLRLCAPAPRRRPPLARAAHRGGVPAVPGAPDGPDRRGGGAAPAGAAGGRGGRGDRGAHLRRRLGGLATGAAHRLAAAVDGADAALASATASARRGQQRLIAQAPASGLRGPDAAAAASARGRYCAEVTPIDT